MNVSPIFRERRADPPSAARIDHLAGRTLEAERRRDAALNRHARPLLERFLDRLDRRRRRAFRDRLLSALRSRGPAREAAGIAAPPGAEILLLPRAALPAPTAAPASADRRPRRRLLRIALLVLGASLAGCYAAEPLLRPAVARIASGMAAQAAAALRCGDAAMLRDAEGRFLGAAPLHPSESCGSVHLTAPFDDATALRIAEAIGTLEGGWRRGHLTFFGQDLVGLGGGAAFELERRIRGLGREEALSLWLSGRSAMRLRPRGSGPLLSAFEALAGQPSEVRGPWRKLGNVVAASIFVARRLGGDSTARAHFLAERMTVVHGTGRPLAGAVAAELLFGGPPGTLGEVCLFAAASTFHLYQSHPAYGDHARRRHLRALSRARVCAARLAADAQERGLAEETIARFENPVFMPPSPPAGAGLAIRDAIGAARVAAAEGSVRLTLDAAAQEAAARRASGLLERFSPRLSEGLCFSGECDLRADHLVAAAEILGDSLPLRVVLTNRHGALLGPFESVGAGAPVRLPPAFGAGSQHKTLLALIAARNGEGRLCNRRFGAITNVGGPPPVAACAPGRIEGWVSAEEALGRSLNLPWIDLTRRRMDETRRLETLLGFLGEEAGPEGAALGFGRRAPPERFMALFAAIARGGSGAAPRTEGLTILEGRPAYPVDLEAFGYAREDVRRASALLAAPLEADGTLRSLADRLRPLGCAPRLGKTGTTEVDGGGAARSRTATVVLSCGRREFVVFASLESSASRRALGDLGADELGALVAAAVSGLRAPE